MAKANQRALSGKQQHSLSNEYKIPIEDRMAYMKGRSFKWVNKKKHEDYVKWKKDRR